MKINPYERKAQYYETDQMGIIHHSNYIRWFEEARLAWMEQIGVAYKDMEEAGLLIPVLAVACEYKKFVCFDETVDIYITITEFSAVKFCVAYEVVNKETKEVKVTGTSKHCFVDKQLKPVRMKRDYKEFYDKFASAIGLG